ncbi:MAG: hypothetical protein R3F61_05455 [Myxococcota bacterium]
MAGSFEKTSLFAEHLKSGARTHAPPSRSRESSATLDDLFSAPPSTPSSQSARQGRIPVKPW